jgi:ribosomal protein RSM22 (predicted rRNA methylase)
VNEVSKRLGELLPVLIQVYREGVRGGGEGRLSEAEQRTIAMNIRTLSRGLTRERELVGTSYLEDPGLLGAYLLYFWPVSYAQNSSVLSSLRLPVQRALDLGGGPGPSAMALFDAGAKEVVSCDQTQKALRVAQSIAKRLRRPLVTLPWKAGEPLPKGKFDCILLSHVLNELMAGREDRLRLRADFLKSLMGSLSEDGFILLIEPALLSTSRETLELKGMAEEAGFEVLSPCFFRGPCPALERPEGTCHAEYPWTPPPLITRLAHAARIGRESLKETYLVLGRKKPADEGLYRVVSDPMLSKSGRIRYLVCSPEGRVSLSAPKDASAPWARSFMGLKRWEVIRFSGAEKRENGYGLVEGSSLQRVKNLHFS